MITCVAHVMVYCYACSVPYTKGCQVLLQLNAGPPPLLVPPKYIMYHY